MFHRKLCFSLVLALSALVAACASVNSTTKVAQTWKDPAWTGGPLSKFFVISLMETQLGGRAAVEDAIVARMKAAGVDAVASHSALVSDEAHPEPQLIDAIRKSGADAVMLAQIKRVSAYEPYAITMTQSSAVADPEYGGYYDLFQSQGANMPNDYKIARVDTRIYRVPGGKQIWGAYTDSYDAANFARNVPGYTLALVDVLERDKMISVKSRPAAQ